MDVFNLNAGNRYAVNKYTGILIDFLYLMMISALFSGLSQKAAAQEQEQIQAEFRITNGVEVANEYPWMASLSLTGQTAMKGHFCGGTLINADTIVTAAHCAVDFVDYPLSIQVTLSRMDLRSNGGVVRKLKGIIIHPEYRSYSNNFDIALLKLAEPVQLDAYPRLPAFDYVYEPGSEVTALGWGNTKDYIVAPILQQVSFPLVADTDCSAALGKNFVPSSMICAEKLSSSSRTVDGLDTCNGDSGGPLFALDEQGLPVIAGLTSWGDECASDKSWGAYTRVASFSDWVNSNPPVLPYIIKPPKVTGKLKVGSALSCNAAEWGGDNVESFHTEYRWKYSNRKRIPNARHAKLRLSKLLSGSKIFCEVIKKSRKGPIVSRSRIVGPVKDA